MAEQFVTHRPKLYAIAHRALGSPWGADDAVQEAWLRLQRTDIATIKNLEAWLTTVISRVCIDMIRQQASRREDLDRDSTPEAESSVRTPADGDPSDSLMRIDDLGLAMQVVLDSLGPLERLALVLHDVFALSYDDIAPIVERTPTAARQLASRARARLRAVDVGGIRERQDAAIGAFLDAARNGDFGGLLQLLDPEIELRSDGAAVELATAGADHGAPLLEDSIRGVDAVARVFAGRAELTRLVSIDGAPAAAYVADGTVHAVYLITFVDDRIATLDVLADAERLASLQTVI
ncbi:sigma-70 family RNA polymerase sigma factor [Occultella gossypii]|uniref:Sigma-70 family RNA polymerase sigma factor n=1 Tax=Occultella gossypii TaxID=2800820 RepID=A0ABS7SEU4_9MICO|nr:sigma-70 family RNA polymerase sigma factor [Occultella gossypii]MBZ2198403.1 sigma-70 family RNA polymerase sigma factor [Occultella gossypii]